MTKSILSAFGAFICVLCTVVTLTGFAHSGEAVLAILAALLVAGAFAFVGWGLDGTKIADYLSSLFADDEERS